MFSSSLKCSNVTGHAVMIVIVCVGVSIAEDWPGFLGSQRNGKSSEIGIVKDWTAGQLEMQWVLQLGEGYGIGSVVGDRFFQLDRVGNEGRLRCLDTEKGRPLWEYRYTVEYDDLFGYDSGPRASPVIDENRVYIYGVTGQLHCVNIETGKLIWKVDLNAKFDVVQNFFGVGSSPVIYKDAVLVMVGGSSPETKDVAPGRLDLVDDNESAVVILDKRNGEVRHWLGADLASYSTIQLARMHDRDVAIVWGRGKLAGFDPLTAEVLFEMPYRARTLESVNAATPVVEGNRVFVSECYGPGGLLVEVDSQFKPHVVWSDQGRRDRALAAHWNTPVLHEGALYGSSGRHTNGALLRCVQWETGQVKWSVDGYGRASMTYVDGHLIVLDEMGKLFLVRATDTNFERVTEWTPGEQDPVKRLRYPCWAAPVVADGRLYVRSKDRLVCFRLVR